MEIVNWLASENNVDKFYVGQRAGLMLTVPSHVGLPPPLPMLVGSLKGAMAATSSSGVSPSGATITYIMVLLWDFRPSNRWKKNCH